MINTAVLARAIPMNEGEERDDILKCEKMKQLSRMPTSSGSGNGTEMQDGEDADCEKRRPSSTFYSSFRFILDG